MAWFYLGSDNIENDYTNLWNLNGRLGSNAYFPALWISVGYVYGSPARAFSVNHRFSDN